ncbi:MFS transporter [Marinobacter sp. F4206]|uniref:MFS transporter n=1 Tax=Marinobacter sp. F4206 TaxID=2861777 RepID=UPI001C5DF763|nr:MFS transporter [Marinobacter sp. F4206]MBW4934287.1 MFS transporter [Marinobacter sp. F4206]
MVEDLEGKEDRLTSLAVVLPLALVGFFVASGCWTLFAVAGVHVRAELSLSSLQFGFLLAMPMAVSALLAIPAGLAAQNVGARRVMLLCLAGLAGCMVILLSTRSFFGYLLAAGGLGLAGGFYCAGLQFVTAHCELRRLGLVLGVFGSGVTGAGLNYYLVPLFAEAFSWRGVALAYLVVLLLILALMLMLTSSEDAKAAPAVQGGLRRRYSNNKRIRRWQACAFFGVVAGSFFALALWLPDYLSSQFRLDVQAGARLSQWFVIPGALAQIVGGALSDRYGSAAVISRSLVVCLVSLFVLSYPPMTLFIRGSESVIELEFALPLSVEAAFIIALGLAMGCAMGSLQRLAILNGQASVALVSGLLLVGACSVAFLLPVIFGAVNYWLGIRTAVFMILFILLAGCLLMFARDSRQRERQSFLHRVI